MKLQCIIFTCWGQEIMSCTLNLLSYSFERKLQFLSYLYITSVSQNYTVGWKMKSQFAICIFPTKPTFKLSYCFFRLYHVWIVYKLFFWIRLKSNINFNYIFVIITYYYLHISGTTAIPLAIYIFVQWGLNLCLIISLQNSLFCIFIFNQTFI